jgi:hypothetical protein
LDVRWVSEGETRMTRPEQAPLKRRRQILDDETTGAHRFDASKRPDTSAHRDASHQDTWARNFVNRLAGLIRKIGGEKQH